MPFCEIPNTDIRLFWRSNLPNDDLKTINDKPVVLLLSPLFLDITFLDSQFSYEALSTKYNLIAFDHLAHGRTEFPSYISSGFASLQDTWTDAALMGLFCLHLGLPPVHIFAPQNNSVNAALRFSILFPNQVLSLTLCGIPGPTNLDWAADAYSETLEAWSTAQDLESLEEVFNGLAFLMFRETQVEPEELDKVVEHWHHQYPPSRSTLILGDGGSIMTRVPLRPDQLKAVTSQVCIINGDSSDVHPVQFAHDLADQLINVTNPDGEVTMHIISNGPENIVFPARFAEKVNKFFLEFLSSTQPPANARPITEAAFSEALQILAGLEGLDEIKQRAPLKLESYSRVSPDLQMMRVNAVITPLLAREQDGFNPTVSPTGQPVKVRPFSERHHDQFFAPSASGRVPTSRPSSANGSVRSLNFSGGGGWLTTGTVESVVISED